MKGRPAAARHAPPEFWWMVGILLCTLAAYAPTFQNGFVNLDDYTYITAVRPFTIRNVAGVFTRFFEGYHPLSLVTLSATFHLFEFNPWMYHAVNVLLHLANTVLAFLLVQRLFDRRWLSLLSALLFGLHPVHVEAVAWVTSRKDVQYAFFYLFALVTYVRFLDERTARRYVLIVPLFLLSVLSKGMAVSFPLSMLAIDVARRRRLLSPAVVLEKLPFLALSTIFGLVSISAQRASGYVPQAGSMPPLLTRIGNAASAFARYIIHLLDPSRATGFHPYPAHGGLSLPAWQGAAVILVLLALLVYGLIRARPIAFGAAFFVANIVLILQFVPVADFVIADRYNYLASLGFCVLLAAAGAHLLGGRASSRAIGMIPLAVYVGVLAGLTLVGCTHWQNGRSLWTDVLAHYPTAGFPLNMRGCELAGIDLHREAIADFNMAARHHPGYPRTYLNRGQSRHKLGDLDGAYTDHSRFIGLRPYDPLGFNNRGLVLHDLGLFQGAYTDLSRAIELGQTHLSAHLFFGNRAVTRLALGDPAGAVNDATAAIARHPRHYVALTTRARAHLERGDTASAISDLDTAIDIDPEDGEAYRVRARANNQAGNWREAVEDVSTAMWNEPMNPENLHLRAELLAGAGHHGAALADLAAALALDPDSRDSWQRLGSMKRALSGNAATAEKALAKAPLPSLHPQYLFVRP